MVKLVGDAAMTVWPDLLSNTAAVTTAAGLGYLYANRKRGGEEEKFPGRGVKSAKADAKRGDVTFYEETVDGENDAQVVEEGGEACKNLVRVPPGNQEAQEGQYINTEFLTSRVNDYPTCSIAKEIRVADFTDLSPAKIKDVTRFRILEGRTQPFARAGTNPFPQGSTVVIEGNRVPEGLFENCGNIAVVTFTQAGTVVEARAFKGCTKLAHIRNAENVTEIGDDGFRGCRLERVHWGNLEKIGMHVFDDNENLKGLRLPREMATVDAAFDDVFGVRDGVLIFGGPVQGEEYNRKLAQFKARTERDAKLNLLNYLLTVEEHRAHRLGVPAEEGGFLALRNEIESNRPRAQRAPAQRGRPIVHPQARPRQHFNDGGE